MATKYFKNGEKATLFVDPITRKKIAGNQVVAFEDKDMKTDAFKTAKKFGHIEQASKAEFEGIVEEESNLTDEQQDDLDDFKVLKVDDMRLRIFDEYEIDEAEQAIINKLTKAQLIDKYTELLTGAE